MTKIDAINKMLRYVGELPVPTSVVIEELPDGHEALQALEILDELNRELQETAYWFNTEDWSYPEVDGYITIPTTVISIQSTGAGSNYLIKGNQLYDVDAQTKIFTNDVTLRTIFEVEFTELPASFASLVMYEASKQLHTFLNGDVSTQEGLDLSIQKQMIKVEREHMANKNFNLIRGSRIIDRTSTPTPLS